MAWEAIRRGAASPSPLSSPTPSTVTAFAVRKDTPSPFAASAAFRDATPPSGASHASHAALSTDPVHATLSPRPMSPMAHRIDHSAPIASTSASSSNAIAASHSATSDQLSKHTPPSTVTAPSVQPSPDKTAERAFYRRILFQNLPAQDDAPTITNDAALDHEIYLLLAYLLRETVLPWYSKLTPDRELLTQVTSIIVCIIHTVVQRQTKDARAASNSTEAIEGGIHATRAAPQTELPRLHDWLSRDIPLVLRQHCSDFKQAQAKVDSIWTPLDTLSSPSTSAASTSLADQEEQQRQRVREQLPPRYRQALDVAFASNGTAASPLQITELFHAASPHPGLNSLTGSLDGKIDLTYLRIAVLNLLSSLLPADEYAPDTEKFIVRDVLVTVLRGTLARSFRPWFIVQSMHKALDAAGWASDPSLPSTELADSFELEPKPASTQPDATTRALSAMLKLLIQLPTLLLRIWTFLAFTAFPFVIRAYLDLFNVQRAASRKRRKLQQLSLQPEQQEGAASLVRSSSRNGRLPSSLSTGSLHERKMHGRFPSHKFYRSHDDTITTQGFSSSVDGNLTRTQANDVAAGCAVGAGADGVPVHGSDALETEQLRPDYVGNWLDVLEEVLQSSSHMVLRAMFGFARTILATIGLDQFLNRMAVRRINAELRDTQKLTRAVRELRRLLLPNGHLPVSVPDPNIETQEAEWIRLRIRLVCCTRHGPSKASQETMISRLVKQMLMGSAHAGLKRGDAAARMSDIQVQLQRVTMWLEPFCSPQAAGPNTLLAILLLERTIVMLCPDLALE